MKHIMYKLKLLTKCLESSQLNITYANLFITSIIKSLEIINSNFFLEGGIRSLVQAGHS